MVDTGFKNPATASQTINGLGSIAWTTIDNIFTSNDLWAINVLPPLTATFSLEATNFSMNVPADATIDGIEVTIERRNFVTVDVGIDQFVRLMKSVPTQVGDNLASLVLWTVPDVIITYGGPTELWGTTWTPAEVNSSGFGVALSALHGAKVDQGMLVDHFQIKVYFSIANGPQIMLVNL